MINMRYFYKKKNIEKNKLIFCFLSRPLPVEQLAAAGAHKIYLIKIILIRKTFSFF